MFNKIKRYKIHKNLEDYRVLIVVLIFVVFYMFVRISVRPINDLDVLLNDFLAGLFLISGIMMLLKRKSFQTYLKKYDLLANKFDLYLTVYPIIFLVFGMLLHINSLQRVVGVVTVVLLSIQTFGMIKSFESGAVGRHLRISSSKSIPVFWFVVSANILIIGLAVALSIVFGF